MKLTPKSVVALQLPAGKTDSVWWDDDLSGFGFRLRTSGDQVRGTYLVQYRVAGRSSRLLIGQAGTLTVEQARGAAKKALAEVALGGDPQGAKRAARHETDRQDLRKTLTTYLDVKKGEVRDRTFREIVRYLTGPHFKVLHPKPLDGVTRKDVAGCLTRITANNGSVSAGRARAALSAFYAWAMGQGLADTNPVIGTNKPADSKARERVLSDAEMNAIWNACLDSGYGRIVRLLILTGCRREEIGGGMRWSAIEFERGVWTLPAERSKNGRAHMLPLPAAALEIIASVERQEGHDCLFGGGVGHGFQRWSASKRELDVRSGVTGWRLHDIRRTVATRMGDIGIQPHVIEAVLNHQSGHKRGVAGVYNRSGYEREVKTALAMWAERVTALVEGRANNVVTLRG